VRSHPSPITHHPSAVEGEKWFVFFDACCGAGGAEHEIQLFDGWNGDKVGHYHQ
jgi:hypothetical protein